MKLVKTQIWDMLRDVTWDNDIVSHFVINWVRNKIGDSDRAIVGIQVREQVREYVRKQCI